MSRAYSAIKTALGYCIAYAILFWIFLIGVKVVVAVLRFVGFTI